MSTTRFDAPVFNPEPRDNYCSSCGNVMRKQNMGMYVTCGCVAERYKKLLAEHQDLQARVLVLEGLVAALDAKVVIHPVVPSVPGFTPHLLGGMTCNRCGTHWPSVWHGINPPCGCHEPSGVTCSVAHDTENP